jgi:hypothetical protein
MTANARSTSYSERDYNRCDVCGVLLEPDRLHIMINNGHLIRNVFCCRKHLYVMVEFEGKKYMQERTDRELEHLSNQYRQGRMPEGWE